MNAKLPHNTVDKKDIVLHIMEAIKKDPNHEFEVSSTDLAREYGVKGPTIDYHISRLIKEGVFEVSPKEGRYKRKIFIEPKGGYPKRVLNQLGIKQEKKKIEKPLINDMDKFREIVTSKIKDIPVDNEPIATSTDTVNASTISSDNAYIVEPKPNREENVQVAPKDAETPKVKEKSIKVEEETVSRFIPPELTLSDQINLFIEKSKSIESADMLISKPDKEILSVMTESIQQNLVYMKDLSNQLELMENLSILHQLIDERNKMIKEMEQIRTEHTELLKKMSADSKEVTIDPVRVRSMHQIIINTLDNYVELPNHALALQRKEFREQMTKEIADLANYIVGVDK